MELNQVDIHYLIAAICVISSALVFYTIGVWGERLQKKLKLWHIIFFLLGLVSDAVGTSLMFVHASWAIWTYVKGSAEAKRHFNRFSIVVWCIWLIPYLIGMAIGMHLHA